jgi:Fe-S-cluster containining protein
MSTHPELFQLQADVETRVVAIREARTDWPCGKGCDACCRSLADVPQLTAAEWSLLRAGLATLSKKRLEAIRRDVEAMTAHISRPLVCPLLDQPTGACPVYAQRPVACRTYGFYVQRGVGLYCSDIEERTTNGDMADVMWGNHDAIDRRLDDLGERRSLTEWFATWD